MLHSISLQQLEQQFYSEKTVPEFVGQLLSVLPVGTCFSFAPETSAQVYRKGENITGMFAEYLYFKGQKQFSSFEDLTVYTYQ